MYINIKNGKDFYGEYPDAIDVLLVSEDSSDLSVSTMKKVKKGDADYENALEYFMFMRGYVKKVRDVKKEYLVSLEKENRNEAIQCFLLSLGNDKPGVDELDFSAKSSSMRFYWDGEDSPVLRLTTKESKYVVNVPKNKILAFSKFAYAKKEDCEIDDNIKFITKDIVRRSLKEHLPSGSKLSGEEIRSWLIDKCSNELESVLCLDENIKVICDVKSRDSDEIILSASTKRRLNNGYVFHNHPEASSFSASDVLFAMRYNLKEIVVGGLNTEGRIIIYVLKRGDSWNNLYDKAAQWFEEVDEQGLPGIPPDVKMEDKRHKINKQFSEKFGFEYSAKIINL